MSRMTTIVAILAPFLAAANAVADHGTGRRLVAFVPDLPPGSIYHLAFVTNGGRDATSDQISDYDAFVNANADANPDLAGINWLSLGSTPTVDAIDHVPISGPIYRLDGELLANDQADLWDGDILAPINVTPSGAVFRGDLVYTGSYLDGTAHPCSLGSPEDVCFQTLDRDAPFPLSVAWTDPQEHGKLGFSHPARLNQSLAIPFYAMSEPLSVPGDRPRLMAGDADQ